MKESLEREMRSGFEAVNSRFDAQALRMDRQAALIQTGSRWIGAQLVARRYAKMTPEERSAAAKNAAEKRWAKPGAKKKKMAKLAK